MSLTVSFIWPGLRLTVAGLTVVFFFFCLQDPVLWACLATMAAYAKDLNTAETAYAAIDEVCIVIKLYLYNHLSINLRRREPRPTTTAEKMAPKSIDNMSKFIAFSLAFSLH